MIACGVTVLENETALLEREGDKIAISGTLDPRFSGAGFSHRKSAAAMRRSLSALSRVPRCYSILLSHRPELLPLYAQAGFDLVLSGDWTVDRFFSMCETARQDADGDGAWTSRGLCVRPGLPRVHNRPEIIEITLCR